MSEFEDFDEDAIKEAMLYGTSEIRIILDLDYQALQAKCERYKAALEECVSIIEYAHDADAYVCSAVPDEARKALEGDGE